MKLKKLSTLSFIFFIFLWLVPDTGICQRGCCSHHGGVCGDQCCDGTSLSAKCRGTSYTPKKSYTPKEDSSSYQKKTPNTEKTDIQPTPSVVVPKSNHLNTVITFKDGKVIKTQKAWEEDGQIKCYLYNSVIGYPKEKVEKIETINSD